MPSEGELFSLNSHLIDGVAPINSVFLRLKPDLVAEFVRATRFGPDRPTRPAGDGGPRSRVPSQVGRSVFGMYLTDRQIALQGGALGDARAERCHGVGIGLWRVRSGLGSSRRARSRQWMSVWRVLPAVSAGPPREPLELTAPRGEQAQCRAPWPSPSAERLRCPRRASSDRYIRSHRVWGRESPCYWVFGRWALAAMSTDIGTFRQFRQQQRKGLR